MISPEEFLGRKPGKALFQKMEGKGGRRKSEEEDGYSGAQRWAELQRGAGHPERHAGCGHERKRQMGSRIAGSMVRQCVFKFLLPVLESQGKGAEDERVGGRDGGEKWRQKGLEGEPCSTCWLWRWGVSVLPCSEAEELAPLESVTTTLAGFEGTRLWWLRV